MSYAVVVISMAKRTCQRVIQAEIWERDQASKKKKKTLTIMQGPGDCEEKYVLEKKNRRFWGLYRVLKDSSIPF